MAYNWSRERWTPQHDASGRIRRFSRTIWNYEQRSYVTELFDGVRCELCGELLLVGRFGMVCSRSHGKIVHSGHESRHAKMYPELVIGHQHFRDQCKAIEGCLK
jgi:hypothetical protein